MAHGYFFVQVGVDHLDGVLLSEAFDRGGEWYILYSCIEAAIQSSVRTTSFLLGYSSFLSFVDTHVCLTPSNVRDYPVFDKKTL